MIGLIERTPPARATAFEILPPRCKNSSVSIKATILTFFFSSFNLSAISYALRPSAASPIASSARIPVPIAAVPPSTT